MPRKYKTEQEAEARFIASQAQPEEFTAFAVREVDGDIPHKTYYQPTMIKIRGGHVVEEHPLQEPTIYEALAYEYLMGDVQRYYAGLWLQNVKTKERV